MIEKHQPTPAEVKIFLQKVEERIQKRESTKLPPRKYESRL